MRLKGLLQGYEPLPQEFLRLGQRVDGSYYGWNFSRAGIAAAAGADIIPGQLVPASRGMMRLRAPGSGGIQYVSRATLGVDARLLSCTDNAPSDGYQRSLELDFGSAGGVLFVHTQDDRYAQIEFCPDAFFVESAPDIRRDLSLRYVHNPEGSRKLYFQEALQGNMTAGEWCAEAVTVTRGRGISGGDCRGHDPVMS